MYVYEIQSRHTVIPCVKRAVLHSYIPTSGEMYAIVTGKHRNRPHMDIRTVEDRVRPIRAVFHRVAG